ncbi:MAG: hypothetical protein HQL76_13500 [Magnetococcales bacterium]|nr:hypothetical protein [Magnetococcales bacterium]
MQDLTPQRQEVFTLRQFPQKEQVKTTQGTVPHCFRKWVMSEVLPSIRKTDKYQIPYPSTRKAETVKQPVPAIPANFPKKVQSLFMFMSSAEASCKKGDRA